MDSQKIEIIYLPRERLKHLDNNPRKKRDREAIRKLAALIREHGFQNPLQVYEETQGDFMILCGNHRFDAGVLAGMKEFPCIVYRGDRKQAIARAISDNKSNEWTDWNEDNLKALLLKIDEKAEADALAGTGFAEKEIQDLFREIEEEKPEVEFSEELLLSHNYVVLYFDNDLDWQVAVDRFGLKQVKDHIPRKGQPVGIGRVIRGDAVLKRLADAR